MTPNDIPNNLKCYVGRIFSLRDINKIAVTTEKTAGIDKIKNVNTKETFGLAVFVYDETHSKVKVTSLNKKFYWINKASLHKELSGKHVEVDVASYIEDIAGCDLDENKKAAITQLLRGLINKD